MKIIQNKILILLVLVVIISVISSYLSSDQLTGLELLDEQVRCKSQVQDWKSQNNCFDINISNEDSVRCFQQSAQVKHFEESTFDSKNNQCVLEYKTYSECGGQNLCTTYVLFDVYNSSILDLKINNGEDNNYSYDKEVKRLFDYDL